jgi:transcriptional antiterminator|tara:strand:- start:279 stop:446 length:168 start_codon:yes stop_codon:yes gene_type:complete
MLLKEIFKTPSQPTTIMELMDEVKRSAKKLKQTLHEINEWEKSIINKSNNEKRSI